MSPVDGSPRPSRAPGCSGWAASSPTTSSPTTSSPQRVDTNDQWIRDRVGIQSRRIADADTQLVDLAAAAGELAVKDAGLTPTDVDTVIVIMPVTGVPLPFVSYGGSSMFAGLLAIGLLQKIHLRANAAPAAGLAPPAAGARPPLRVDRQEDEGRQQGQVHEPLQRLRPAGDDGQDRDEHRHQQEHHLRRLEAEDEGTVEPDRRDRDRRDREADARHR